MHNNAHNVYEAYFKDAEASIVLVPLQKCFFSKSLSENVACRRFYENEKYAKGSALL